MLHSPNPVRANSTVTSISAQPETFFLVRMQPAWSVSHQDSMRVPRFCHLNNPTRPASDALRENELTSSVPSRQDSMAVAFGVPNRGTRLASQVCHWRDTVHAWECHFRKTPQMINTSIQTGSVEIRSRSMLSYTQSGAGVEVHGDSPSSMGPSCLE